eukprot:2056388-Pyramimonas_sp.AAC.1
MSDGVCNKHIAQRHPLIVPIRTLPFWLDVISMYGCMCGYKYNNDTCERPEVIKFATPFVLNADRLFQIRARWTKTSFMKYRREYPSLWIELGTNRKIESPPMEDGDGFCLLCAKSYSCSCPRESMLRSQGMRCSVIRNPPKSCNMLMLWIVGYELQRRDSTHNWINGLGNEVLETARRNCSGIQEAMVFMHTSTEPPFSAKICLANSLFGVFNADD